MWSILFTAPHRYLKIPGAEKNRTLMFLIFFLSTVVIRFWIGTEEYLNFGIQVLTTYSRVRLIALINLLNKSKVKELQRVQ